MIFKNTVVQVSKTTPIIEVVEEMAASDVYRKGIAVVVDELSKVVGVFNDFDLIRLLGKGKSMDLPVSEGMTTNPITVKEGISNKEILDSVQEQLSERGANLSTLRDVIVVNQSGQLTNVLSYVELINSDRGAKKNVAVYGLGFVGITLSASLARIGHKVYGVDINKPLISALRKNQMHVYEPRLSDTVGATQKTGNLVFTERLDEEDVDHYIIAVGTPVNDDGVANLDALTAVSRSIGFRLKRGDLVMLRSTVPVGTTKNVVLGILESESGLTAGVDFHLAFAPERTAEGKAMEELSTLPQIVGGLTTVCSRKAEKLWSSLVESVIQVETLEAAELVKLINNSFRDLSFAFSNSVALLCDRFNINAFKLIRSANEGYPRNPIPLPSPGVGGYCLTKDPYLFAAIDYESGHARLSVEGRKVNEDAQGYTLKQVNRYLSRRRDKSIKDAKIFILGLAFKGWPETNDLRGSSSVFVANALANKGASVYGYDHVVPFEQWSSFLPDVHKGNLSKDLRDSDVILIMNNHPKNVPSNFLYLLDNGLPKLVFDGWSLLDPSVFNTLKGVEYSTMGYLSNWSDD